MRRQELIYAQTDGFTRNRIINNVTTSSDICKFDSPIFDMSGATKIVSGMTSNSNGVHLIINDGQEIPFNIEFVDNISSFTTGVIFSYNIYKYNEGVGVFTNTPVYKSPKFNYSGFMGTNIIETSISSTDLTIDGEFLIKSSYEYNVCTNILNKLGERNVTSSQFKGAPFNLYNEIYDYYFIAIYSARVPIFDLSPDTQRPLGSLTSTTFIPTGERVFVLEDGYSGFPIVTLNGLVLSPDEDYLLSGNTLTLSGDTVSDDILTMFYVGYGNSNGLVGESQTINTPILSGGTGGQGNEKIYFNTTTGKYEIYTDADPINDNEVIISINGAVLAPNIDYYQSITNKRRFILEGNLIFGDVITIVYNTNGTYVGSINTNKPFIYWTVDKAPQKVNGKFILELSDSKTFDNILFSSVTNYVINSRVYNDVLEVSGSVGTKLYYRVLNEKNYITISGDIIQSISSSEIVPIIIQSNSLNSY